MELKNLWKNRKKPTISFEFFPGRGEKAEDKLDKVVEKLADLNPDFMSVTFGAGGATREGSLQLIKKLKRFKSIKLLAYFAAYGLDPGEIISILSNYRDIDVKNLLCVRGDQPKDREGLVPVSQSFSHASELIPFVKEHFNFCIGAAGYPEGHIESRNLEEDLKYLKLKVEKGAGFIISQYFYDNNYFFDFRERCRSNGINVPITAGVMPVYNVKLMRNLAEVCGATITQSLLERLQGVDPDDKKAVARFGIDFAYKQCRDLIKSGVEGLHFYTMNKSKSVMGIIKRLKEENLL